MANMEQSECSSVSMTKKVPYSLSDIQLPESPGHQLKSKDLNNDENCNNTNSSANLVEDQKSPTNLKVQSNGMSTVDNENSNEGRVSDNESKENIKNSVSPEKPRERKESVDSRQTDESSGAESEKDVSQSKKSPKHEDSSSNVISDSKEKIISKETTDKEHKSSKHHQQSYESDNNNNSSDLDKYKHRQADSKRKTHVKHRKRNRRSRSQSSSSSSSQSSDSSPKRRHSKKSVITHKSKSYVENEERNKMSDKNNDKQIDRKRIQDRLTESIPVPSGESSKKRLKIKRDNVVLDIKTSYIEPVESTSRKPVETPNSDVDSTVEKQPKEEIREINLSLSDLPYVPRKVSLSNRKLNRKSSEDKSNESKSKKSKWESFAACQKASNTISISTDSLKNWFPDFKLVSEPSSSMELEPDEQSASATDEKSSNIMHTDTAYKIDTGLKQDPVSQSEMEDSESQEPNFEESMEQGPVSKIIFIQNLVRPFTLGQLKDLLKQNGSIVEEYFWIDKIKSKCFVMYETEKEAIKAKNALHNARWPLSNPKILSVEFSDLDQLELHKKGNEVPPKPIVETPAVEVPEEIEPRPSYSGEDSKRKDRERRKEKERSKGMPPVREWDKDKVLQDSPERERPAKEEKSRSSDKKDKKESKKRPNEDTPAKLLDDLFQKTKTPPCIYWLPLTEEQAKQKEEAKKLRKLEREKRNQQLKEQEEAERRNKRARSNRRSREKENHKSSTRSRSPVSRRR